LEREECTFRKLIRNKKALDTIIATLLMLVIVVAASVMVFVYATGLFGALTQAPNFQKEALSLEYSTFSSTNPTVNVTLFVRNTGTIPVTLTSYYVKDANNNIYAKTSWSPQTTITPTALAYPRILIGSACSCNSTGSPFTFQTGNSYTMILVSSRGTSFPFAVIRYG
jgi:archaeal type IV pilus assembly protein PilA